MADQLRCLGFDFSEPGSLEAFFEKHWAGKAVIDMAEGVYLRLTCGRQIVCILSVDPETQEVLDWDMHFMDGEAVGCSFVEDLALDEAGQSGTLRLCLDPAGVELPVIVSAPMLAPWSDREPGSPGLARLAAYAEELTLPEEIAEDLTVDEEACAMELRAHVVSAERFLCPDTGRRPWLLRVTCRGVALPLLCAEEQLTRLPSAGQAVSARCVMTALVESGTSAG